VKSANPVKNTLAREFAFSDGEFSRISKLVYGHAGINLPLSKKDMVYSRLAKRLRANKINTFSDYLQILESNNATEWEAFINAITTNVTSFYREEHHFEILANHIKNSPHRQPLQIWCNAASTGEEPYTIAMTMMDLFDSLTPPVRIIATDIDTNALQKARDGVYSLDQIKNIPPATLQKYFLKGRDKQAGFVKVRQELRDLISFNQLNLLDNNWPIKGPFAAIFCRNVMIYFDKSTQHKILQRFVPVMFEDALLFAGHSESLQNMPELFKLTGRTVYSIADKSKSSAYNTLKPNKAGKLS
jgi:chemotaxis protein methyltransferase CheR